MCPQRLADLSDADVRALTSFPTKNHLVKFYEQFLACPTQYQGKQVPRFATIDGYAGYQERYRTGRRTQENAANPDLFNDADLDAIPLKGAKKKLEKMRGKLRKSNAVKQYHSASEFQDRPLRSTVQLKKFHAGKRPVVSEGISGGDFHVPFTKQKRDPRLYKGTNDLHVEQEFLIWVIKVTKNWPNECLAIKFLGSYGEAATRVIRNVLVTWTAFLYKVMKAENWWVDPDVCERLRRLIDKRVVEWDYIGDCSCARSHGLPRNRCGGGGGGECVVVVESAW